MRGSDLASASCPQEPVRVEAVAGLSREDICQLWQWTAVNKPSSMTVEGFTSLLLNEIDSRSDRARVRSITSQYLDILQFADNCLSSNGLFAQARQLRDRIASLSPASVLENREAGLADAHSKSPSRPAMPKEEDTHG